MTIAIGEKLPEVTFRVKTDEGPKPVTTDDVFKGKTVVLFGVPGAFTPTCTMNHLPGYLELNDQIRAKGVDTIAVVSVNDPFVMGAWQKATEAGDRILFLADGGADFARATGLDIDLTVAGLGVRSRRYAMIVDDGVVRTLHIEDAPGQAEASAAGAILAEL